MEVPAKIQVGFQFVEVGEDFCESPLFVPHGRPAVVILRDASEEYLSINCA